MTDFDLERLGDMWRQEPDPAEMEALRRTAETVARRARRAQTMDVGLAIVVSMVVMTLALSNPEPETLLVGAAAIGLMLYSSIRQRHLRKLELMTLTGSAEEMLDQSIARLRATVKRTRLGLIGTIPAMSVGIGFGAMLDRGPGSGLIARFASEPWLPIGVALASIAIIAAGFVHYIRTMRRDRNELDRLVTLREAFREEQETNGF
ncbi:MAG: hypothetical protein KF780_11205 [Sphingomonas sp.]|nr:hypothetical protein [Sphingomonas sp.]